MLQRSINIPFKHRLFFTAVIFLLSHFNSYALIDAAQSGPWNSTSTWSGGVVPVAGNDVRIMGGYIVTVDVTTAACANLTLGDNGGGGGDGTLIFNPGTILTASGSLTCGQGGNFGFLDMSNGGTFICATWASQRNGSVFTPGVGKVKFTGTGDLFNDVDWGTFYDLEIASGTTRLNYSPTIVTHNLTFSGTGILDANTNGKDLEIQGDWTETGTSSFTEGTRTVTFNGTGSQTISNSLGSETFDKLVVNKASGTLTCNTSIIGVTTLLTMTSGTFVVGNAYRITGAGGLTATGGDLQLGRTATPTQPQLAGAYNITGGTITLNGPGDQTLRPSVTYYNVVLGNSGIKTTTTVTTIAGDLTISGSATMATNSAFTVSGTLFYTSSGSTTLTAATNVSIGNYQQSSGTFIDNGVNITVTGTTWNKTAGTFTCTGRVLFQGTANQTVTNVGGQTFANVTLNNGTVTNTITLSGAMTVSGNITFTKGQLITNTTDLLILNSGTTLSSVSSNSFVNGAVQKITAATTAFAFPLGDNNAYLPIEITPSAAGATTWIGQYNYNNQPVTALTTFPTLDHISNAEYWQMNRTAGAADAVVKLYWNSNSFASATGTDWANLRVSQYDGTNFVALGTTQSGGNAQAAGSIYTSANVTNFTSGTYEYFTLGSTNTTNELGRTRYSVVVGGVTTANWTASTWATRSGGAPTASAPTSANDVYIEAGMTIQVSATQAARLLQVGTTTAGTLQFITTNSIRVDVGLGGVNITSNGDVTGTTTGTQITSTGDVVLNKVVTNANVTLITQTTAGLSLSGTGGVPNFTNNTSTTNTGNITIASTLTLTSGALINNGTLTAATVTANNTLTNNGTLNITNTIGGTNNDIVNAATGTLNFSGCTVNKTVDFTTAGNTLNIMSSTCGTFSFTGLNTTFYNLIISNTATKIPGSAITINGDFTIASGAIFDVNSKDIILKGNWTNNDGSAGSFVQGTRTVTLNGTGNQTITNTGGETFYNLTINKTSGDVVLAGTSPAIVSNTLDMTAGNINLNGTTLTLGTAAATPGTLSYTDGIMYTNTASGGFQRWVGTGSSLSATTGLFPIGSSTDYAPMVITSTAAPTTGGTITAYYKDVSFTTDVSPTFVDNAGTVSKMDNLSYVVSQSSLVLGAGQSLSMKLSGTSYGTVGDVNDLRIILAAGTIAPGADGVHGGTTLVPQVNRTGLNPANLNNSFTIGSVNTVRSPLPIELLSFTADAVNNSYVDVKWVTATEINNDFFTIEKSIDGFNFKNIATTKGAGNSTSVLNYSSLDDSPYKGVSYYRLKQTDFNGQFTYSNTVAVEFGGSPNDFTFNVYPNPNDGENINLSISGNKSEEVLVVVYDVTGKKSFSKIIITQNNDTEVYALDPSNKLSAGIYMITATSDQSIFSKRLVVK